MSPRRLLTAVPTLLGVLTLVFLFLHCIPGDPVDAILGENAARIDRERLRTALGLDLPLWKQYANYLTGILRGDLGRSLHAGESVTALIVARAPATLALALAAGVFAVVLSLPLGVISARHRGSWLDAVSTGFAFVGASVPNFVLGPLLVLVFSIDLGWLPVSGAETPSSVLLPAITLGLGMSTILTRLLRSALLDTLHADFIRTARAKGLSEVSVFVRHALRNALLSVTTVFGLQLGSLLGGAVVTETIFAWPGVGRLILEAIRARDYPLVQGCVLVIALTYVGINLVTDLTYQWLDPRVRLDRTEVS